MDIRARKLISNLELRLDIAEKKISSLSGTQTNILTILSKLINK